MTYIFKPSVSDANLNDQTLSPSKIINTSAITNTNENIYTNGVQSFTAGLTLTGSTGGLIQSYKTTSGSGITSAVDVIPTNGFHTLEVSSGYTGNLVLNHSASNAGAILIIKNVRGSALTIDGSKPTTTASATGSTVNVTLSAANANIRVGQLVTGGGSIATGTQVAAISGTSLTLSLAPLVALSNTTLTFQSFIDFSWNGSAAIPAGTTTSIANQASVRLISNGGVYWSVIG